MIRRRPNDWWLVLSALTVPLSVLFGALAPVLIMPLFNTFEPLNDAALAERVRALAKRSGVRIADVYGVDMSRQTEKPNAFFAGLGRTKRIALGDTLTEKFPAAEVEGVVAHELGHQVHADIWKLIGFGSVTGFGTAWLLSRAAPPVLAGKAGETGVGDLGDEASYPVVALLLSLLGFGLAPVQAAFSRAIERQADTYALNLTGDGESYASAMARLASLSLADPDPPKPVVWFLYSHPPVADRIRRARSFSAE
ncbi:MAG TPA: M48 family metalloprotease [Thermomicrobiales bacterium]|nr:M48 family metalloprotease [Thermomicrobiales bacterium]